MSNRLRYILFVIGLAVVMLVLQLVAPLRYDWTPTFGHEDKNPFGCMVFDSVMAQTMPCGYHTSGATLRQTVQDTAQNNVLIVKHDGTLTQANVNDIKKLMARGCTVMLVGYDFYEETPGAKAFSITSSSYASFSVKEISWQLAHDTARAYDTLYYRPDRYCKHRGVSRVVPGCIAYQPQQYRIYRQLMRGSIYVDDTLFLDNDTLCQISYTKMQDYNGEYQNMYKAVMLCYGKGKLVVVSTPLLFTNFGILDRHTHTYVMRLMNTLADGHVVRLDETLAKGGVTGDAADKHNTSALSYILSQPPLRWAYYTLLVGVILLFCFGSRRRQRVIPVIPRKKNHDMEFVRLIGQLYFERHDNADLVIKKYKMLTDSVRTKLDIDLTDRRSRADNIHTLAQATGISANAISALLSEVANIREQQLKVADTDMIRLVDQMDTILKNLD